MLLHALPGDLEFARRGLVGLFDERMQKDDLPINDRAVENSGDAFRCFQP